MTFRIARHLLHVAWLNGASGEHIQDRDRTGTHNAPKPHPKPRHSTRSVAHRSSRAHSRTLLAGLEADADTGPVRRRLLALDRGRTRAAGTCVHAMRTRRRRFCAPRPLQARRGQPVLFVDKLRRQQQAQDEHYRARERNGERGLRSPVDAVYVPSDRTHSVRAWDWHPQGAVQGPGLR